MIPKTKKEREEEKACKKDQVYKCILCDSDTLTWNENHKMYECGNCGFATSQP